MFDHETRIQLSREQADRLRLDWPTESPRPARRAIGKLLIRAGERLSRPSSALAHEALQIGNNGQRLGQQRVVFFAQRLEQARFAQNDDATEAGRAQLLQAGP